MAYPRDILAEVIIDTLAPAPGMAVCEGRIQHGELALIPDPIYPMCTFHRDGTAQDTDAPLALVDLLISANSVKGLDEAWALHAEIVRLLDHQAFTRDGVSCVFNLTIGPIPSPESSPTPLYRVIDVFRVRLLAG
jgi:hypothetical protein